MMTVKLPIASSNEIKNYFWNKLVQIRTKKNITPISLQYFIILTLSCKHSMVSCNKTCSCTIVIQNRPAGIGSESHS